MCDVPDELREQWRQYIEAEREVERLGEEAELSGDYSEYDERRADLNEIGNEFTHRFAEALGMESSVPDLDGDADGD